MTNTSAVEDEGRVVIAPFMKTLPPVEASEKVVPERVTADPGLMVLEPMTIASVEEDGPTTTAEIIGVEPGWTVCEPMIVGWAEFGMVVG